MTHWFQYHLWITYFIIYLLLVYVFNKVFRVKRLPILKEAIIYLLIAVGALMLLFFQAIAELPVVLSLSAAVAMMLTLRIRLWFTARRDKQNLKS